MFEANTRVLVVDDMMTMRKAVRKILMDLGLTDVTEANDGKAAWEKLEASVPAFDLVVSDWNMPNMTGLELLRKVRGDERFIATTFILVTAEAEQVQIIEAIQSKVDAYVVKPFNAETLKKKLVEAHKKRRLAA